MGLTEDLTNYVRHMLCVEQWTSRDGREVPVSENLRLGNDAVKLEATVLYADISGSTQMVDNHPAHFAAEIYKAFLHCAAKEVDFNKLDG